jgi:hypothetical protein
VSPVPGAAPTAAAPAPDGAAPDPKALRQAILAYRDAILASDRDLRTTTAMVFSNLSGGTGDRPLMLLPGMLQPHGIRLLSLAWLGREATPAEQARYAQVLQAKGARDGTAAVIDEIASRGLLARMRRTDGSPAAIEAIRAQVAGMLRWRAGDLQGAMDAVVPPIPAGPALDPVRDATSASAPVGTPNSDRANGPAAQAALREAIRAYGAEIDRSRSEMTMILGGRLVAGGPVYLLPGLMLPHGATIMMLAWLGRAPEPAELARWKAWTQGADGHDPRQAFGEIMADVERIALAARLPETDGSPEAVTAMRQEVAARLRW